MALPNPDYLALERFQWNGNTRSSALLGTTASTRTSINWEGMDVYQRDRFHNLVMAYADHNAEAEADALDTGYPVGGWQDIDYGGNVVGASSPGLAAQTYTASAVIDGSTIALSVNGATATTFTLVISQLNAILATDGTATITAAGNIDIVSDTTGVDSTVVITDVDLFSSLDGFVSMGPYYTGAAEVEDVLDVNDFYHNPIRAQFFGLLKEIPIKPIIPLGVAKDLTIYNDNADGQWKYLWDDSVVV